MRLAIILALATTAQAQLADLKPLRKIHWSFGLSYEQLAAPSDDLKQVLRICGGVSIASHYQTDTSLSQTVALATELRLPCAVVYSPRAKLHPDDMLAELSEFNDRMRKVASSGLDVRAVFFDDERNIDIDCALPYRNALYRIAKHWFPSASVEWYEHGSCSPAATDTGWYDSRKALGDVLTDAWAVVLYRPGELGMQCEAYRRTCKAAPKDMPVTPWIALGAGFHPARDRYRVWVWDWNYPDYCDWWLGKQIHGGSWYSVRAERYAPWDRAKHVVLYPPICDPNVPGWLAHFTEYARGAQ